MGVKTGNQLQSLNTAVVTTRQLDIKAVLVYKLGTILQIGVMILVLLGMEKLLMFIDNNYSVPS
ncbi:hypothetical protein [Trichormus azollae]|jgi:tryptophan-rich sensory protein|uniref:hypothetical protein n=1 Tax=Trichormus azollae TaxID=1164 RepID=UPI0001957EEC|nr:hypothetical protein [Trichormus azollae]